MDQQSLFASLDDGLETLEEVRAEVARIYQDQLPARLAVRSELDKWWSAVSRFYSLLGDAHGYYQTLPDEPGSRMADPGAIEMRSMLHNPRHMPGAAARRAQRGTYRRLSRSTAASATHSDLARYLAGSEAAR